MAKNLLSVRFYQTAIFADPNQLILLLLAMTGVDAPVDNVDIVGGLPVMLASSPVTFDDEEMKDTMHRG